MPHRAWPRRRADTVRALRPGWCGAAFAVVGTSAIVGAFLASGLRDRAPAAAAVPSAAIAGDGRAAHVYLRDCATCHDGSGAGLTGRGPSLRGVGTAAVEFQLTTGRMPLGAPHQDPVRRAPRYDRATIDRLVAYLSDVVAGGPAAPTRRSVATGDIASGGVLFRAQCAACHTWAGTGGALLRRSAPSTHPASTVQIAEAIRTGPGNMPAFGSAALTHRQLRDVVAYTRLLRHPDNRGGLDLGLLGPVSEGAVAVILGFGSLFAGLFWIGTRQ